MCEFSVEGENKIKSNTSSDAFGASCRATASSTFLFSSSVPTSPEASSPASQLAPPEHIPLTRVSSRGYDLQERRRTGNMTGTEQAKYQRIPTDESEAQTLASADLDGIKSEYKYIQAPFCQINAWVDFFLYVKKVICSYSCTENHPLNLQLLPALHCILA